ncbi:hypothetical protein CFC21_044544 [Triticum aestivum]|uniref:RING-type E3 ubiquitin transferase n=3 Tax=Triticum TaxID=4564 RepID=A0A9R1JXN7_WHEAT|nr:hypothetical protein CFC21_044544 [Triticum aestivum]CDM86649.1 unnamed protein product [Triticum aestivum]VAH85602.1 unnamed protein product [Triticum turgidum subsp. durum]
MGVQQQQQETNGKEAEEGGVGKRRKVATDVTMDLDILDCPVCFLPLRPPIFQCTLGHAICSSCRDKLQDKCCLCSLPTVYNRCHMVENVVESIKLACSNSSHGCTARITYYQKEDHEKGCQHAPCFCPETGCSFSGPTKVLLEHFLGEHDWCYGEKDLRYGKTYRITLLGVQGPTVLMGNDGHLFLVNMTMESLGGVISVCCVEPHISASRFKCRLALLCGEQSYSQTTEFLTTSTNLRDGFPKDCFPLLVPKVFAWRHRYKPHSHGVCDPQATVSTM